MMLVLMLLAAEPDWNAIAARLLQTAAAGGSVREALEREQPALYGAIAEAAQHPELQALWGTCSNFDELAKGVVVDPAIVDALNAIAHAPPRKDRQTPAGIQHTFGYFFSTLQTAFGYKRERWTKPDIELGFGLPRGVLGVAPNAGTLFDNVTYFAGRIALADDAAAQRTLDAARAFVAPSLAEVPYTTLSRRRLLETLVLANARVELRTDFVMFTQPSAQPSSRNVALLVYSVLDSRVMHPQLITAFPVSRAFIDGKSEARLLGADQPILTQYNAVVPGLSGASPPRRGTRTLAQ